MPYLTRYGWNNTTLTHCTGLKSRQKVIKITKKYRLKNILNTGISHNDIFYRIVRMTYIFCGIIYMWSTMKGIDMGIWVICGLMMILYELVQVVRVGVRDDDATKMYCNIKKHQNNGFEMWFKKNARHIGLVLFLGSLIIYLFNPLSISNHYTMGAAIGMLIGVVLLAG